MDPLCSLVKKYHYFRKILIIIIPKTMQQTKSINFYGQGVMDKIFIVINNRALASLKKNV